MTSTSDAKEVKSLPPLVAYDLSPIDALSAADEAWLRDLVRRADTDTLSLSFTSAREVEQAPVAYFDWQSGKWWAGRFVGEVTFQGRTLKVLPRFGMPALRRWLSRIWGVRLLSSAGSYTGGRVWLWELIAKLWSDRLVAAAKHGLPRVRVDETHYGRTVRGRLLVRQSVANLHAGEQTLVSRTRNRRVDPRIGGILLAACGQLRRELHHVVGEPQWLTERGRALVKELGAEVDQRAAEEATRSRAPVRYSPMTESYRPAVELSQAILGGRPFMSTAEGERQVYGVLLDMAEIWELYVFHLLRDALPEVEVVHSGRSPEAAFWLLRGNNSTDLIGAMKPDILIATRDGRRAIVDAKYKLTTPGPTRPHGLQREDLYQMAAYLSAATEPGGLLDGALVYPASNTIDSLQARGPFRLARSEARIAFLGLGVEEDREGITNAEAGLVARVCALLGGDSDMCRLSSGNSTDPR